MKQIIHSPKMLGQYINRVRKSKQLTQHQTGDTISLDQTTISSIEQGANGTRIETIFRLLTALDLELVLQEKQLPNEKKEDW